MNRVNSAYADHLKRRATPGIDVVMHAEADEFWSYVGDTSHQRWTWYALERETGIILAITTANALMRCADKLLNKLRLFQFDHIQRIIGKVMRNIFHHRHTITLGKR